MSEKVAKAVEYLRAEIEKPRETLAQALEGRVSVDLSDLETLLAEVERLQKLVKEVPFKIGDVVREVGDEEPTGEIMNITEYPAGKGYRVKLYKEYANIKSIIYYAEEIELIKRTGD